MRVGLTGHFSSGKSTVSRMFTALGAIELDTDQIAREIVLPESEAYKEIVEFFGKDILNRDLTIDRKKLASIVFSQQRKLAKLNSITHPRILSLTLERSATKDLIHMINVPLLFQSGYDRYMDKIIIVTAHYQQLVARGVSRDSISNSDAERRIKSQNSINNYFNKADYIIDNSSALENTQNQVEKIWNSLTANLTAK